MGPSSGVSTTSPQHRGCGHAQHASGFAAPVQQVLARFLKPGNQRGAVVHQSEAVGRERDIARIAMQQPSAQVGLQLSNRPRDAGLRGPQNMCGLGKAFALGHLDEHLYGIQIHGSSAD